MSHLIGISTSLLQNTDSFEVLADLSPDFIELYNFTTPALEKAVKFCSEKKIKISLHTPVPYDEKNPLTRFDPTSADTAERKRAVQLLKQTVACAKELAALHVVVHYPGPYPDSPPNISPEAEHVFITTILEQQELFNVPVLIENLTYHPGFNRPDHYQYLAEKYKQLLFCIDFGHAWMRDIHDVETIVTILGSRARACHLYSLWKNAEKWVRLFPSQSEGRTLEMPWRALLVQLLTLQPHIATVVEPGPSPARSIPGLKNDFDNIRQLLSVPS